MKTREKITIEISGLAWLGFWVGLGIVIAAAIIKGEIVIQN